VRALTTIALPLAFDGQGLLTDQHGVPVALLDPHGLLSDLDVAALAEAIGRIEPEEGRP
jgi:hypothetical protein